MKSIRVGSGAGTANDCIEPALVLLEHGNLDYLFFECLAERTLALANLRKKHDPQKGYDQQLQNRMGKVLDVYKRVKPNTKIISNMGAANPLEAARIIDAMCRERGLNLKVAAVIGDDVLGKIDKYYGLEVMETNRPLDKYRDILVNANAYTGCAGIVKALEMGSDIVITGRCADPSLTVGPCVHEFGWEMDDWKHLGCATIAGHLLECGAQVCGGYFADLDRKIVPDLWNVGFPIGTIYEDGTIEISKVEGTGGRIDEMTVKEQALYEIQDPANYMTPDVIADFTNLEIKEIEKNKVRVTGGCGKQKSGKLKVNCGYLDCYIGEGEMSYGGYGCVDRAKLAGECVVKRLERNGTKYTEIRVDIIGYDSLYTNCVEAQMRSEDPAECRLRVAARCADKENAEKVAYEVEALYCTGPAGGGGARRSVREIVSVASVLIDEKDVILEVVYPGGEKA